MAESNISYMGLPAASFFFPQGKTARKSEVQKTPQILTSECSKTEPPLSGTLGGAVVLCLAQHGYKHAVQMEPPGFLYPEMYECLT